MFLSAGQGFPFQEKTVLSRPQKILYILYIHVNSPGRLVEPPRGKGRPSGFAGGALPPRQSG